VETFRARSAELVVEEVVEIAGILTPADTVEFSPFNPSQTYGR
jgi:hypothetical protein